jgi:hypothetical protein
MPFTIPDKGEGDSDIQSILFQEDIDVLVDGIASKNCVLSGCGVTGGSDMTPAVAKGAILSNGVLLPVTAGDVTIGTADGSNPRLDLIVANSSGTKAVRAGTAAAAPKPPARTSNDVVLAQVLVPASDTTIGAGAIIDRRVFPPRPVRILRSTSAVTFNTTSAIQTYANIVLPSGLFLTGEVMRFACGGNMLINSGTPTVTLTIDYGGSTMFADVTAAFTADGDRKPWQLDLDLIAVSGTSQILHVRTNLPLIGNLTAPTTGQGDAWSTAQSSNPIRGTATVDSDAGDRDFRVRFTMSVSNAANEIVCDYAYAYLM